MKGGVLLNGKTKSIPRAKKNEIPRVENQCWLCIGCWEVVECGQKCPKCNNLEKAGVLVIEYPKKGTIHLLRQNV